MDNLKHVRQQGRDAKKANDDNRDKDGNLIDTSQKTFTEHDCPYGPGDTRDAWIAGFGGQEEAVEQADTSKPTTDDIRPTGNTDQVRDGKKPKKGKDAADQTKVVTDVTGTGETSLQTKVEQANPEQSDQVPTPSTTIGDPAASVAPTDAKVQEADPATGRSDSRGKKSEATGHGTKPDDLM